MSHTKATPGPWTHDESRDEIKDPNGVTVASIHYFSIADESLVPNARLIAAAPDLLEALRSLVADTSQDRSKTFTERKALDNARALIARIEGGAE